MTSSGPIHHSRLLPSRDGLLAPGPFTQAPGAGCVGAAAGGRGRAPRPSGKRGQATLFST